MRIHTMVDELKEIDGVGESMEDYLKESGYEEYSDLAEADHEELSEEVDYLTEDKALDLVVQAQNLDDLEQAEVEEDVEEEVEEDVEEEVEEDVEEENESYPVEIDFNAEHEYDTFYHTLIEERCNLRRTNRDGVEMYDRMLASMRDVSDDGVFTVEMTESELNNLHNAVLEQRYDYQGENLIEYMDALKSVETDVNAIREEYLF